MRRPPDRRDAGVGGAASACGVAACVTGSSSNITPEHSPGCSGLPQTGQVEGGTVREFSKGGAPQGDGRTGDGQRATGDRRQATGTRASTPSPVARRLLPVARLLFVLPDGGRQQSTH